MVCVALSSFILVVKLSLWRFVEWSSPRRRKVIDLIYVDSGRHPHTNRLPPLEKVFAYHRLSLSQSNRYCCALRLTCRRMPTPALWNACNHAKDFYCEKFFAYRSLGAFWESLSSTSFTSLTFENRLYFKTTRYSNPFIGQYRRFKS